MEQTDAASKEANEQGPKKGIVMIVIAILLGTNGLLLWQFFDKKNNLDIANQTIKDNILAPKVVGDVMGLHPLVIILPLLICAKVAGVLGVLMALPLASAVNVVLQLLLKKDQEAKSALAAAESSTLLATGGPHAAP